MLNVKRDITVLSFDAKGCKERNLLANTPLEFVAELDDNNLHCSLAGESLVVPADAVSVTAADETPKLSGLTPEQRKEIIRKNLMGAGLAVKKPEPAPVATPAPAPATPAKPVEAPKPEAKNPEAPVAEPKKEEKKEEPAPEAKPSRERSWFQEPSESKPLPEVEFDKLFEALDLEEADDEDTKDALRRSTFKGRDKKAEEVILSTEFDPERFMDGVVAPNVEKVIRKLEKKGMTVSEDVKKKLTDFEMNRAMAHKEEVFGVEMDTPISQKLGDKNRFIFKVVNVEPRTLLPVEPTEFATEDEEKEARKRERSMRDIELAKLNKSPYSYGWVQQLYILDMSPLKRNDPIKSVPIGLGKGRDGRSPLDRLTEAYQSRYKIPDAEMDRISQQTIIKEQIIREANQRVIDEIKRGKPLWGMSPKQLLSLFAPSPATKKMVSDMVMRVLGQASKYVDKADIDKIKAELAQL